ncbi:kinesin light chain 3-like [Zingiber officinale]|uniref:kinesin light chain 3-like n=1 Tax=Zingiber officinale TaxID=94328 RepID=UPI001C4AEBAF|nr:kinesin light chain 3-like [Zingiber officinale]
MWIRRGLALLRRLRRPVQLAAPRMLPLTGTTASSSVTRYGYFKFGFSWDKHKLDLMLGIILSGQTVFFLGANKNFVFAQDASAIEAFPENGQEQAHITGLRRIEDGSVISNTHTTKWRIFTDNGRELSLKGKLDEAERFFQAALEEAKKGFGEKDPHVASSCNNLAELYRVKREYAKAEPLYIEAISILEDSYGPNDIRVGAALHNLGQFYFVLRKLEQACKCYERALKIKGRILGFGHTDYAETMYHLGRVLYLQKKEKEAEDLIRESIRILEEAGMGESTICIRRMNYLAQILLKSNRLNVTEGENLQRKILHIMELSKGWDSVETIFAAEKLALTLQSLGNLNEAEELLERCLAAKQKILHENHLQVAVNMLHLAQLARLKSSNLQKVKISEAREELDKAKLLLYSSIRIAKENLGFTGVSQKNLKNSTLNEKDKHLALITLLQALESIIPLEVKRQELAEPEDALEYPSEIEVALRECISIFKESYQRSMVLKYPDVKKHYILCLKHLADHTITIMKNPAFETIMNESQKSRALKDLVDEAQQIEAELSSKQH